MAEIPLFQINPAIDRTSAAAVFQREGRVQIRDFLTSDAAATIGMLLETSTPWGLGIQAGDQPSRHLKPEQIAGMSASERSSTDAAIKQSAQNGSFSFIYAQYPILDAYLQRWDPGNPFDLLLEHINAEPFLNLVREVTGIPHLVKADAQATLFAPGHFLPIHDDTHKDEGWRVAYVMSFTKKWRPDHGGYLLFFDEEEDIVSGLKPRFNALNLFRVPQRHSVSYVPPFAPVGRFSITGWFRDR